MLRLMLCNILLAYAYILPLDLARFHVNNWFNFYNYLTVVNKVTNSAQVGFGKNKSGKCTL